MSENSLTVASWSREQVTEWFRTEEPIFLDYFTDYDGAHLIGVSWDTIDEIQNDNISMEDKKRLYGKILRLCGPAPRKVFQDCIHGSIELHPLLVAIINTPEFQRLRNIKQTGGKSFVYPGACHTRFEHSIGVCHLAGELVRKLKAHQPDLIITDEDILCVEAAGLCHDLGHGPFSHLFDARFLAKARPDKTLPHEKASVMMLRELLDKNNQVSKAFKKHNLHKEDISFIEEQIFRVEGDERIGRPKEKYFLYEIVADKRNGIDVDKWDYFAHDCHYLGLRNSFDHRRIMNYVRVLKSDSGEQQICARYKEAETLYDMFYVRRKLHKFALQHRVCKAVEIMLCDAMLAADKHLRFPYTDEDSTQKFATLSESIDYPEAFCLVTDHVYHTIRSSKDENLTKARRIIERIERRNLYAYIHTARLPDTHSDKLDIPAMTREIVEILKEEEGGTILGENDVVLNETKIDYGMGPKNPIDTVGFYTKKEPNKIKLLSKAEMSTLLSQELIERNLVFYCKKTDTRSINRAQECFTKWCMEKEFLPLDI